jgi:hypothetical protein
MAQKSDAPEVTTPLAASRHTDFGTMHPSPALTQSELRIQAQHVLATILSRREEDQFPVFHALRDETAGGAWRLVVDEKKFYSMFIAHVREGERECIEQRDLAFIFADAAPVYLRMLYDLLDLFVLNGFEYYLEKRRDLCALPPTGDPVDDRSDAAFGPPQKRFTHYVLVYNGAETRHRQLIQGTASGKKSKTAQNGRFLGPKTTRRRPLPPLKAEDDVDSDSSSLDGTPRATDIVILT